jgi:hypothetical protein
MSHTKEPWIIVPGGRFDPEVIITTQHRLDGRKAEICGMDVEFTGHHGDEQKANTRRIVACVNACAGIPTDTLETIPSWSSAGVKTLADVEKQRDELLAALEAFTSARVTLPRGEGSWSIGGLYEAEKLALATITSVKGGA